MFKKFLASVAGALILTASANAAHFVSLEAPAEVDVGQQFTVDIIGDFLSLGLIAGAVQVVYDPALLSLDDFQFALPIDLNLSCPGSPTCPTDAPGTMSIAWGQFLSDLIGPDAGPTLMGTITMTALGPSGGVPTVLDLVDFSDLLGGWFGAGFVTIDPPALNGTSLQIVPLPAAGWMMIGGLGALARFRRK